MAEEFKGLSKENLKVAEEIRDTSEQIKLAFNRLNKEGKDISGEFSKIDQLFNKIGRGADKVANLQENIANSSKTTADAIKESNGQRQIARNLQAKIDNLLDRAANSTGRIKKNLEDKAKVLGDARDQASGMADSFDKIANDAATLDNKTIFFNKLAEVVGDIPGIRKFAGPFKDAAAASKKTVLDMAKAGKNATWAQTLKSGGAAFLKSIKGAVKAFGLIGAAVAAIKFVVDLFISANKQSVELARSMGSSVDQADQLRGQFADIRRETGLTRNNTVQLVKAQQALNEEFGATFRASDDTLDNFTFLTTRVKLSAEEASKLSIRMGATQENANLTSDNILSISNNFKTANGFGMSFKGIMKAVSEATGQVAASFGFSNEAIAKGVLQVRRFGVNLQQASNIASNLLDFEQSIGAELEAELLTGQQFNLERARAKAATGDIAGATADVLSQMQNLTAEQRRSPVIMEAIAKATGISADELQRAYLIQGNNNVAADEYYRLLKEGTKDEINAFLIRSNLSEQARKDIEKRKTAEENFTEAMEDLKSTFVDFVNGGFLTDLSEAIKSFAQFVNNSFGESGDRSKAVAESAMEVSDAQIRAAGLTIDEFNKIAAKASLNKGMFGITSDAAFATNTGIDEARKELRRVKNTEIKPDDFTIRQNPKDTLVMAGGTQFGKETNGLLRQLISAVEGGKIINLEGRKVGETLVMSSYKS